MSENITPGDAQDNPQGSNPENVNDPAVKSTQDTNAGLDASEQARRELQSQRDKRTAELDAVKGELDAMRPYVAQIAQKELVANFLTDAGKDYPHVTNEDLEFLGVSSKEECEAAAKYLEARFKKSEQDALVKVQDTQDLGMTEEEKAKALKDLEKSDAPGSKFLQSLRIRNTKVRQ